MPRAGFHPGQPWAVGGRLDLGTVRLQRVEPNAIAVGVLNDDINHRGPHRGLANAGCPVSYSGPPPHPALDLRENEHPTDDIDRTDLALGWHAAQVFPITDINQAVDHVRSARTHCRAVVAA